MVLSTSDLSIWTKDVFGSENDFGRLRREQPLPDSHDSAVLATALCNVRQALKENASVLERAADLRKKNEGDTAVQGFGSFDDDLLLKMIDRLATVSCIHDEWSENVRETIRMLLAIKGGLQSDWSVEGDALLTELQKHLDNLEWVAKTMRQWSDEFGEEYDRRHPDLPPLPFTPVDMGPTNSSRLPPVL